MLLRRENVIIIDPLIICLMYKCVWPLHHYVKPCVLLWCLRLHQSIPITQITAEYVMALESAKSQGESKLKSLLRFGPDSTLLLNALCRGRFWLFWVNPHYPSQFRMRSEPYAVLCQIICSSLFEIIEPKICGDLETIWCLPYCICTTCQGLGRFD